MKFQGSGLNASPEILSFRWLLCENIFIWVGNESVYFRRDMHSKVPSSFMLVVMADGRPNLSSKKLVDSHMHFSAGNWNYRPTNICIEPSLWSAKGWCYWKWKLNNSPKLNFGHLGLQLEHFTNKKSEKKIWNTKFYVCPDADRLLELLRLSAFWWQKIWLALLSS